MAATVRPRRKERVLQQEAGGTVVLLDVDSGRYYALDEIGGRVWDWCDGSRTVSEVVALVCEHYDAVAETVGRDVEELLSELANEKLVCADA